MVLGLKEYPNVMQASITIPGAGDSGVLEETPGVIYPLLVSKKKYQKSQIIHLMALTPPSAEPAGRERLFGNDLLGSSREKKNKIPKSHHQLSIAVIQVLSGQPLGGKQSCGKAPCAGAQRPVDLPRL